LKAKPCTERKARAINVTDIVTEPPLSGDGSKSLMKSIPFYSPGKASQYEHTARGTEIFLSDINEPYFRWNVEFCKPDTITFFYLPIPLVKLKDVYTTNQLTPWSRAVLEKPLVELLLQNFLAFY
jgi:hypothetical protein